MISFPFVLHVGALPVEAHLLFEMLAYSAGFQLYARSRKQQSDLITDDHRLWVMIGGVLGAAVFSKLLGFFEHPQLLVLSKQSLLYLFASKTIVGGLLGGLIGVELTKKWLHISQATGDLFCFPIILGMMIGRLGCFFAGAQDGTWGDESQFVFAINGGDGIARHPVPLYEMVFLGGLWISLLFLKRHVDLKPGALFKLFMISYLVWRFCIEWIKPVFIIPHVGLSAIQLACLAGLLYYCNVIFNFKTLLADQHGN
jgi:hypothetical protein